MMQSIKQQNSLKKWFKEFLSMCLDIK